MERRTPEDLTEFQREVYRLRKENPSWKWRQISVEVGKSAGVCQKAFKRAYKVYNGVTWSPGGRCLQSRIETREPERSAEVIERGTGPDADGAIITVADKVGFPPNAALALQRRMDGEYQELKTKIEQVKTETLRGLIGTKLKKILDEITDEDIEEAGLRDKTVAAGIFIDKFLLLDGKATQIISIDDRRQMDTIRRWIAEEARRRSITIDVNPVTNEAEVAKGFDRKKRALRGSTED